MAMYVAQRAAGPRLGLSLSGLVAGFVSSTGTIAALGSRARAQPRLRAACVSGALFSAVATVILLGIVVGAVYPAALAIVGPSLVAALLAFAALLAGVTAATGFVNARCGQAAAAVAAAIAGLFDVHAAAASTLSLAATSAVTPSAVLIPILIAFTSNTGSKLVGAFVAGGTRYGLPVAAGLCGIAGAAWAPLLWLSP